MWCLDEMSVLVSQLETPLQADESQEGLQATYESAQMGVAYVLPFKISKYGGVQQAERAAAVAGAAGLELSSCGCFDIFGTAGAHSFLSMQDVKWPSAFPDMTDTLHWIRER